MGMYPDAGKVACPFAARGQTRIKDKKKNASLHISNEALRFAFVEIRREASAMRSLCKVSSTMKFLRFLSTTAMQRRLNCQYLVVSR